MRTVHILNGDSAAGRLKQSGLAGERLAWREALMAGPTPDGLSIEKWLATRELVRAA
jgi:hypothetical protein